jgi:hypothetical protein
MFSQSNITVRGMYCYVAAIRVKIILIKYKRSEHVTNKPIISKALHHKSAEKSIVIEALQAFRSPLSTIPLGMAARVQRNPAIHRP